jgi:DNA mismatch endonuclease Vsr
LPGKPDIVFPARRKVIEVRGCFWHRHAGCPLAATPTTRAAFWEAKLSGTVARDLANLAALEAAGWGVMIVWECEVDDAAIGPRLLDFLGPPGGGQSGFADTRR